MERVPLKEDVEQHQRVCDNAWRKEQKCRDCSAGKTIA